MNERFRNWFKRNRTPLRRIVSLVIALAMVPGILAATSASMEALGASEGRTLVRLQNEGAVGVQSDSSGGTTNDAILGLSDFEKIGYSVTNGAAPYPGVRTGQPVQVETTVTLQSSEFSGVGDNCLAIRYNGPAGTVLALPESSSAYTYQYGDADGPNGTDKSHIWAIFAQTPSGTTLSMTLPSQILYANGVTDHGVGLTIESVLFFRDNGAGDFQEVSTDAGTAISDLDFVSIADQFHWQDDVFILKSNNKDKNIPQDADAANPDAKIDIALTYAESTATTYKLPDVTFTNQTVANAGVSPYGYGYTDKVRFVEYYAIPKYIDTSSFAANVKVTVGGQDVTSAEKTVGEVKIHKATVELITEGASANHPTIVKVSVEVENLNKNKELVIPGDKDFTVKFTGMKLTSAYKTDLDALTGTSKLTFDIISDPAESNKNGSVSTVDRGIYAYPVCELDDSATGTNKAQWGTTTKYQLISQKNGQILYTASPESAVSLPGSLNKLKKTVKNSAGTFVNEGVSVYEGDTVTFRLHNFEVPKLKTGDTIDITLTDFGHPTGASSEGNGYSLDEMYPVSVNLNKYKNYPKTGAITTYSITVSYSGGSISPITINNLKYGGSNGSSQHTAITNNILDLTKLTSNPTDAQKIVSITFNYKGVSSWFAPYRNADSSVIAAPCIDYVVKNQTTTPGKELYNTAKLEYTYHPASGGSQPGGPYPANSSITYTRKDVSTAGSKIGTIYNINTGEASAITVDNLPVVGDFLQFTVKIKNNYNFDITKLKLTDTYDPSLTAMFDYKGGFANNIQVKKGDVVTSSPLPTVKTNGIQIDDTSGSKQHPKTVTDDDKVTIEYETLDPAKQFTIEFDGVLKPGEEITVTYLLKVEAKPTGKAFNRYFVSGYRSTGGSGPNPGGVGEELPVAEGKWEGEISDTKTLAKVNLNKYIIDRQDDLDAYDLETGTKEDPAAPSQYTPLTYRLDLVLAESNGKPVTVSSFKESPAQGKLSLDLGENKDQYRFFFVPAGNYANATPIPVSSVARGNGNLDNEYTFVFTTPVVLKDAGDAIIFLGQGSIAEDLFAANDKNQTLTNYGYFYFQDITPVKNLADVSGNVFIAGDCDDYNTADKYMRNSDTIQVTNADSPAEGYIEKTVDSATQTYTVTDNEGGSKTRKYKILIANTGIVDFAVNGFADKLPLFEEPVSAALYDNNAKMNDLTFTSVKKTDKDGNAYWELLISDFAESGQAAMPALNIPAGKQTLNIRIETKLHEKPAYDHLKALSASQYSYENNVYVYFNRTVAISKSGVGTRPSAASGYFTGEKYKDEHHDAVPVYTNRNLPTPTAYIRATKQSSDGWKNQSDVKPQTPLANGAEVKWQVVFGNPSAPSQTDLNSPAFVAVIPAGFTYKSVTNASGYGAPRVVRPNGISGATLLIWDNSTPNLAKNQTPEFTVLTTHQAGMYGEFTGYAYNIPKVDQQDFAHFDVRNVDVVNSGAPATVKEATPDEKDFNQLWGLSGGDMLNGAYVAQDGASNYSYHFNRVSAYGDYACYSDKEIEQVTQTSNMRNGNNSDTDNYITVPNQLEEVSYTLRISNNSVRSYNKLVLIDRLPEPGDIGVGYYNEKTEARRSGVGVNLVSQGPSNFSVAVYDTTDESNPVLASQQPGYEILFTDVAQDRPFTTSDWGYDGASRPVTGSGIWKAAGQLALEDISAFQVVLDPAYELKANHTVYVEFKGLLDITSEEQISTAKEKKIAYNSFGYHFSTKSINGADVSHFPEPAKVGVTTYTYVPGDKLTIQKVLTGEELAVANAPERTFYFEVETSEAGMNNWQPYLTGKDAVAVTITQKPDGTWECPGTELFTPFFGNDYRVKEVVLTDDDGNPSNNTGLYDSFGSDIQMTEGAAGAKGQRDFTFTATNTLKSVSLVINKTVENLPQNYFPGGKATFSFLLTGYETPADRNSETAVPAYTHHEPVAVDVAWDAVTRTYKGSASVSGLPSQYAYKLTEQDSGIPYQVDITYGDADPATGSYVFTVKNTAPAVYFQISKRLIDKAETVQQTFQFNVQPSAGVAFTAEVTVAKTGNEEYNGISQVYGPFPYGTTFAAENVTELAGSKNYVTEIRPVGTPAPDENGIVTYQFSCENKADDVQTVRASVTKILNDYEKTADRSFELLLTAKGPTGTIKTEPFTITVTTVDGAAMSGTYLSGSYEAGTTFTLTEPGLDSARYEDVRISGPAGPTLENAEQTFTFTATNTPKDVPATVHFMVRKVLAETDGNVYRTFRFRVTPYDAAGNALETEDITLAMDGSHTAESPLYGPYDAGTTFRATGVVEQEDADYDAPAVSITSQTDAKGNVTFTIQVTNNRRTPPTTDPTRPTAPPTQPTESTTGNYEPPTTPTTTGPTGPTGPTTATTPYRPSPSTDNPNSSDYTPISDNPVPLAQLPGLTTIFDDDVPLANLPTTGKQRSLLAVSVIGFFGTIAGFILGVLGKKKREDEEA